MKRTRTVSEAALWRLMGRPGARPECPKVRRRWLTVGMDARGRERYALVCPATAEAWRAWRRERWLARYGEPRVGMLVRLPWQGVWARVVRVGVRGGGATDLVEVAWRRKGKRMSLLAVFWVLCPKEARGVGDTK